MENIGLIQQEKYLFSALYELSEGNKRIAKGLYHLLLSHHQVYNPNTREDDVSRKWRDYSIFCSGERINTQSTRTITKGAFENIYTLFKQGLGGELDRKMMKEVLGVTDKRLDELLRKFDYAPKKKSLSKRTQIETSSRYKTKYPRGDSSRKGIYYRTSSS